MSVYDYTATSIEGKEVSLSEYKGKVLLVVNTASKCGFTPQFEGLQELYSKYKDQGLEILGFPCNQFGNQDPGEDSEIGAFCQKNYGVDFQMFSKIDVNGKETHPVYQFLKEEAPGVLGSKAIKWNFTKFLVSKEGEVLERFAPKVEPKDLESAIKKQL